MASPLPSGFVSASDLPTSASEEEALKELVRVQAAKIERMEQMLDEAPQSPKMPSYEKASIIAALSTLEGRIKALEGAVEHLQTELKAAQAAVKESGQEVYDVHELAKIAIDETCKRVTRLEDQNKPQDTPDNRVRVEAIFTLLVSRAKTGQRGITYHEAAKALKISKARVCQLRGLIAADCRMEISWHPNKKNTKIIHLKNYSYHNIVKLNV
jgi:hypothetical protein